ncbi:MAG: BatD family protein [Kiritimatiellae bacterium]|nr:BatD family protein [Kiritimatiellia bacterium]
MRRALLAFALLAAAVSGRAQDPATSAAGGPSLAFELRPAQASYWAGQRALAVVTLAPGELDVLAEPAIEIFPEDAAGVERGRFSAMAAPAGSLRWAQPVRFDAPGTFRAEPRLAAEFGRVERRGIMTIQQGLGRRLVSAPGRSVVVKPLPAEGRPADFSGLVGAYSLSGSLDADACAPGDIVNLRWELRGAGAENLAEPPSVAPGREFKVYPPRVEAREAGRLAVSQALVPVSTNAAAVAALELSVFDPAAGAYRTLAAGPFPLRVAEKPPEEKPAEPDAGAEAPRDPAADLPARAPGTPFISGEPVHARFAPADSARELFVLGAGEAAVVREVSPDGAWVRVLRRADGATGWIPASRARTELY